MANVQRGTSLCEVDFSAIEAVLVGWFARDPDYIRLAKLGVHSGLASHILGTPFNPEWLTTRPADLKAFLSDVKKRAKATPSGASELYDVSKRVVHGSAYCLTPHGMVNNFPTQFPTIALATKYQKAYFAMAPTIPAWQKSVQKFAYDHGYLGGPGDPPFGHPFAYKHWFWAVASYKKISEAQAARRTKNGNPVAYFHGQPYAVELGEDAKRCVPPHYKVWMGNYTYKAIGDLKVGDEVIGWTRRKGPALPSRGNHGTEYMTRKKRFKTDTLVRAKVLGVHRTVDRTRTIGLASGKELRCTPDHQWLCYRRHCYEYLRTEELRIGDQICRVDVTDPGECPPELRETAAWMAGFYDGEGSHRGITQRNTTPGDLLQAADDAFHRLGFSTTRQVQDKKVSPKWKDTTFLAWEGGRQAALKFLRWVPSFRYRAQWADRMILSSRFRRLDTVVSLADNLLSEPVVCIKTSTGNYVVEDTCSHNSVAFYPQSTGRGMLTEAMLRLFDPVEAEPYNSYIGDAYYGRTPLRAPIHDSLFLEFPRRVQDRALEIVIREMTRPCVQLPNPESWGLGEYLVVDVEAKVGQAWSAMETVEGFAVGESAPYEAALAEDEEDVEALCVSVA